MVLRRMLTVPIFQFQAFDPLTQQLRFERQSKYLTDDAVSSFTDSEFARRCKASSVSEMKPGDILDVEKPRLR